MSGRASLGAFLAGLLIWPLTAAAANERPNILILMAEDLSPRIGAFGDPVAQTPAIDGLAAQGTRFPNTFTTAGVCAPSRAAHITGMHQAAIGAQHMRTSHPAGGYLAVPPPEVKAYPELLRRAGYYTMTNGKLDYQFSKYGAGSGPFTIWNHEGADPDWNRREAGQPFYALINFSMTHESRMFEKNVAEQREKGWQAVTDPAEVEVPPYYPDTPVVRRDLAVLYDNVHEMDRQVSRWLERLERDGLADDTIVIWTTDHGDGLPRAKRELYDSGIRVPLIVHWPERWRPDSAEPGSWDLRLLSFVDIAPSVLQWAGVQAPDYLHGKPVLADPEAVRDYVFAAKDRLDEMPFHERVARDHRFKYLVNHRPGEPGGKPLKYREQLATMRELNRWFESSRMSAQQAFWFEPRPREELYDLAVDPWEVNNVADDPAYTEVLERMRAAMAGWQERVDDLSTEPEAAMAERFWPGGEQPRTAAPRIERAGSTVTLASETQGASIAYRLEDDEDWSLYTAPFDAPAESQIEAKAVRYGWAESSVSQSDGAGAVLMLDNGQGLRAAVSPENGGELAGLEVLHNGGWHELLYRARDYASSTGWRGKAPFLWPAVGPTRDPENGRQGYQLGGVFYPMPAHGFARDRAWRVIDQGAGDRGPFLVLGLSSDEETRRHYPFDFELEASYRLAAGRLELDYTVRADRRNGQEMPFSIGNHITFRAPLLPGPEPGTLRFRNGFPDYLPRNPDRTFSGRVEPSPYRGEHAISMLPRRSAVGLGGGLNAADLTVIDPSGLFVRLSHTADWAPVGPHIRFNLWADTEEGFFSPEPWLGTQNALNSGAGLVWLKPGAEWRWNIEITPGWHDRPESTKQEQFQ